MKSFLKPLVVLSAVAFLAPQAMAQTIISQPPVGDSGAFAVQDQSVGPTDPWLAKAYDNFTLTTDVLIDGFCWHGLYAEPLPAARSDTDFIIEIWNVDPSNNLADVWAGPVLSFFVEGGVVAGTSGPDLNVTLETGYTSAPVPGITPGGGEVYHYDADVADTLLAAGDYWISIIADQNFDNPYPKVDPEWQWHFAGAGDGFTHFDRANDPPGTNQQGLLIPDKDLAFAIKAVPEPTSILMALCGLAPLGLLRRKRS